MRKLRVVVVLLSLAVPALAASSRAQEKRAPEKPSSAALAKPLYVDYCATCHGLSGKGDGPAAKALKMPPANLTTLALRNKGQFPEMRVLGAIKAGPGISAHGSDVMPVWGPVFVAVSGAATEAEVQLKIFNLMEYIRTLQAK